jgi:hypothetical protein
MEGDTRAVGKRVKGKEAYEDIMITQFAFIGIIMGPIVVQNKSTHMILI